MPKKPKPGEAEKKDSWADDQKEREYYYDDAHGYEAYDPENEEPEEDTENRETRRHVDTENGVSTEGAK